MNYKLLKNIINIARIVVTALLRDFFFCLYNVLYKLSKELSTGNLGFL